MGNIKLAQNVIVILSQNEPLIMNRRTVLYRKCWECLLVSTTLHQHQWWPISAVCSWTVLFINKDQLCISLVNIFWTNFIFLPCNDQQSMLPSPEKIYEPDSITILNVLFKDLYFQSVMQQNCFINLCKYVLCCICSMNFCNVLQQI